MNYLDAVVFLSGSLIGLWIFRGYDAHVRPRKRVIKFALVAAVFFAIHQLGGRQWFYGMLIAMAAGIAILHGFTGSTIVMGSTGELQNRERSTCA